MEFSEMSVEHFPEIVVKPVFEPHLLSLLLQRGESGDAIEMD